MCRTLLTAAVALALGCSGDSKEAPPASTPDAAAPRSHPADPTPLYKSGKVTVVRISDVAEGGLASISPSGASRLYRKAGPDPVSDDGIVEATWCLHRDDASPVCLATGTEELRCLGGSNPVGWRPDEKAVVMCGERETRTSSGSSFDGWDSVLDFEQRRVVELDPHDGPMVTPIWSRDGQRVFAFPSDGKPHRPWSHADRKPISVAPFETPPSTRAASKDDFGPVWATGGPGLSGVMLFDAPALERHPIGFAKSKQDLLDVTPEGHFAVAQDVDTTLGHEGIPWHLLELETKTASPLGVPEDLRDPKHAEISSGGHRVLALWAGKGGTLHLGITGDRGTTWHIVHSWPSGDADRPKTYASDGQLQWDGGPTAWLIAQSDAVLRVDLSESRTRDIR